MHLILRERAKQVTGRYVLASAGQIMSLRADMRSVMIITHNDAMMFSKIIALSPIFHIRHAPAGSVAQTKKPTQFLFCDGDNNEGESR